MTMNVRILWAINLFKWTCIMINITYRDLLSTLLIISPEIYGAVEHEDGQINIRHSSEHYFPLIQELEDLPQQLESVFKQDKQLLGLEHTPVSRDMDQHVKDLRPTIKIPAIAKGYEDVYLQFLKLKLVYKPDPKSDAGRKEFPIASLANPLEGTFDLSGCGDSGRHIQVSTGFRTRVDPINKTKAEIWIVPQFVLQRDPRAKPVNDFLETLPIERNKPFAIMYTWGGWNDLSWYEVVGTNGNREVDLETVWLDSFTLPGTRGVPAGRNATIVKHAVASSFRPAANFFFVISK